MLAQDSCPGCLKRVSPEPNAGRSITGNETMPRAILALVIDPAEGGAPAHVVVAVLLSDKAKSATLHPIVVAVRGLAAQRVLCPSDAERGSRRCC